MICRWSRTRPVRIGTCGVSTPHGPPRAAARRPTPRPPRSSARLVLIRRPPRRRRADRHRPRLRPGRPVPARPGPSSGSPRPRPAAVGRAGRAGPGARVAPCGPVPGAGRRRLVDSPGVHLDAADLSRSAAASGRAGRHGDRLARRRRSPRLVPTGGRRAPVDLPDRRCGDARRPPRRSDRPRGPRGRALPARRRAGERVPRGVPVGPTGRDGEGARVADRGNRVRHRRRVHLLERWVGDGERRRHRERPERGRAPLRGRARPFVLAHRGGRPRVGAGPVLVEQAGRHARRDRCRVERAGARVDTA